MREPVRILSDLHLGHGVSRIAQVGQLRPLLAGAGTVVFNGDTWQELSEPWRENARAMVEELRCLCADEGVDTMFLTGNHDPGWGGPGWLTLAGGRIVITHGDAFFPSGSPWKRELFHAREEIARQWLERPLAATNVSERIDLARDLAREFRSMDCPTGRSFFARAWDAVMPPQRALYMLMSWWLRPRAAHQFLDTYFPRAEAIVFGHFHLHHCWERYGRLLIDTGSFLNPGKAHWVEWNDGWLTRGAVEECADGFQRGEALDTWRFL